MRTDADISLDMALDLAQEYCEAQNLISILMNNTPPTNYGVRKQ